MNRLDYLPLAEKKLITAIHSKYNHGYDTKELKDALRAEFQYALHFLVSLNELFNDEYILLKMTADELNRKSYDETDLAKLGEHRREKRRVLEEIERQDRKYGYFIQTAAYFALFREFLKSISPMGNGHNIKALDSGLDCVLYEGNINRRPIPNLPETVNTQKLSEYLYFESAKNNPLLWPDWDETFIGPDRDYWIQVMELYRDLLIDSTVGYGDKGHPLNIFFESWGLTRQELEDSGSIATIDNNCYYCTGKPAGNKVLSILWGELRREVRLDDTNNGLCKHARDTIHKYIYKDQSNQFSRRTVTDYCRDR